MIASHDTMTYLKPKYWIFRLFKFVWQTQTKPWENQRADILDIRIKYNESKEEWEFAHGLVSFKTDEQITHVLIKMLNCKDKYIRIVHEDVYPFYTKKHKEALRKKFCEYMKYLIEYSKPQYYHFLDSKKNWTELYCNMPYKPFLEYFWKFNRKQWFPSPRYWFNKCWKHNIDWAIKHGYEESCTIWRDFC